MTPSFQLYWPQHTSLEPVLLSVALFGRCLPTSWGLHPNSGFTFTALYKVLLLWGPLGREGLPCHRLSSLTMKENSKQISFSCTIYDSKARTACMILPSLAACSWWSLAPLNHICISFDFSTPPPLSMSRKFLRLFPLQISISGGWGFYHEDTPPFIPSQITHSFNTIFGSTVHPINWE